MDGFGRRLFLVPLAVAFLMLGASCGGGNPSGEFVFLHVFNSYPATGDMSVYGPTGTIASGVSYGERNQAPARVDRNQGNTFQIALQGAAQPFTVNPPLFSMYPQETGTLFIKPRVSAQGLAQPQLYRHLQTGFSNQSVASQTSVRQGFGLCRLVMDNALSVQDINLTTFNFATAFKIKPACTGYVRQIGTYNDTGMKIQTESGREIQVGRPYLWDDQVENAQSVFHARPWFLPARANAGEVLDVQNPSQCNAFGDVRVAGEGSLKFVWAGNIAADYENETVRAVAPTRQYMTCIGWDPDAKPAQQSISSEDVARCQRAEAQTRVVKTGSEIIRYEFPTGIGINEAGDNVPPNQCGFGVRVFSDFFNTFEQTEGDSPDKQFKEDIVFAANQYHFWVLYGRPVNPRSEQWSAARQGDGPNKPGGGGGFIELDDFER